MSPALRGSRRIYSPPSAIPWRMDGKSGLPERPAMPDIPTTDIQELNDFATNTGAYTTNRIATFLERNIVLRRATPADGHVIESHDSLQAGSGPEEAYAAKSSNPQWLRNKALNYLALADHIEQQEQRGAVEKLKLDKITREHAIVFSGATEYRNLSTGERGIVDRIYNLEQAARSKL